MRLFKRLFGDMAAENLSACQQRLTQSEKARDEQRVTGAELQSEVERLKKQLESERQERKEKKVAEKSRRIAQAGKLRILVIDDSQINLDSAKRLLGEIHDVTVCSTHKKALEILGLKYDEERQEKLRDQYRAEGMDWSEVYDRSKQETLLPYWDAVLCDLNMPAYADATSVRVGEEMMVGWQLALIAAKNGARYVAVVTNTNHHKDVTSAMLDPLGSAYWNEKGEAEFTINGAKVGFWHDPHEGSADGKGWDEVLNKLITS